MNLFALDGVIESYQLAICHEALRVLIEEGKVTPSDVSSAIDKAAERLKRK